MRIGICLSTVLAGLLCGLAVVGSAADNLEKEFVSPPDSARPWVYWFFMDGNLTREGMTADLEAMKKAGIGGAIYLEVGIGIPRGPVEFMSKPWRELVRHAVPEAEGLGLGNGHRVGAGVVRNGRAVGQTRAIHAAPGGERNNGQRAGKFDAVLPRPQPRTPFFGEGTLTPELPKAWKEFYRDVVVLAFPTPAGNTRIADVDEKALYYRAPYSSQPGVKPFLPSPAERCRGAGGAVHSVRQARRPDGQTRPRRPAGVGRAAGQLDDPAIRPHHHRPNHAAGARAGPRTRVGQVRQGRDGRAFRCLHRDAAARTVGEPKHPGRGLTALHFDSWEMSSQNWSGRFREEFTRRRGYDPLRLLPAMTGRVVDSAEMSERFLWDLRQTAQELVVENHVLRLRELGGQHGLMLSLEPYDLNPCADLKLGRRPTCRWASSGRRAGRSPPSSVAWRPLRSGTRWVARWSARRRSPRCRAKTGGSIPAR